LVNGLPLVQIELKRSHRNQRSLQPNQSLPEPFFWSHGLFQYVQLFVISNGVNTKYLANNKLQSVKQTSLGHAIIKNTELTEFAAAFLNPAHLGKMIAHYIVINETHKVMMILPVSIFCHGSHYPPSQKTLTTTLTFGIPQVQ
jgi:type I restriction enzyme R subunit